ARYTLSLHDDLPILVFLEPMEYNNTYTVATTAEVAKKYHLENINDLKKFEHQLTAGFTLEFKDRYDGYKGMQDLYNLDLKNIKRSEEHTSELQSRFD